EHEIPQERKKDVTYGSFTCTVQPKKENQNRTRFTAGDDKINYPGEVATPTADMLVAKILFNSVISTPGVQFMTMDISNFYLMTPLLQPEYIRIRLADLPDKIIQEYRLHDKATPTGFIHLKVTKGMYGLPQAGLLANELLEKRLNTHGYYQSQKMPGLWKHNTRPIQFTLVLTPLALNTLDENMQSISNRYWKSTTKYQQTGRGTLHQHPHEVGLPKKPSPSPHARLCQKGTHTIRAHPPHKTKPTLPPHTNQIWNTETVCKGTIHLAPPQ
ncbi:hypothetical protein ACHAW6_012778, partial [Cyclotella cf. meneghiniana]